VDCELVRGERELRLFRGGLIVCAGRGKGRSRMLASRKYVREWRAHDSP